VFTEQLIFWVAAMLLVYTYAGYPLVLYWWARVRRRGYQKRGDHEPTVSILVVACNEEANVRGRLDNLLALDYPRYQVEIIIGSDGSTDGTVNRANRYIKEGVRVVEYIKRRGKPAVLNDLVPLAAGTIIVFADMRQRFHPSALRALVAPFVDRSIGGVSGELMLTDPDNRSAAGAGVGFYWKYEKFIRRHEALIDSTVGVSGAIYAIRRVLFRPIATDTIIDDVLIPMLVVRQGFRVIYEPDARASDDMKISAGKEFKRKIRTIAGNFQLLIREPWLLNPVSNRLWLQTISHKYCRLLSPLCLVLVLGSNVLLLPSPLYMPLLILQIVFYTAAFTGYLSETFARKTRLINVPYTFCLLNWATVVAFFRFLSGRQAVTWDKGPTE